MKFTPIDLFNDPKTIKIYNAYISTFPENERRSKDQFEALFSNPKVKVCSIVIDEKEVGYIILWNLSSFIFLEHFEVFETFRNFKYGSKILEHLIKDYPQLVLEAEPPTLDEMAARRINFYERNGFSIIDKDYIQPSYGPGKNAISLYLLSTWTPKNVESIISEIKKVVYNA